MGSEGKDATAEKTVFGRGRKKEKEEEEEDNGGGGGARLTQSPSRKSVSNLLRVMKGGNAASTLNCPKITGN